MKGGRIRRTWAGRGNRFVSVYFFVSARTWLVASIFFSHGFVLIPLSFRAMKSEG